MGAKPFIFRNPADIPPRGANDADWHERMLAEGEFTPGEVEELLRQGSQVVPPADPSHPSITRAAKLMNEVEEFLSRFVAYPSEHALVAHALWVAHAHFMGAWESTPRLAFLSPEPGSGKSRALEVTELLVPRPILTINATPAFIFRRVSDEAGLPTVLADEIDTVFGPKAKENEELRGFYNAGHRRGAVAGRCVVKGKTVETEELPAYCAVAMAGLGNLPDTILTRSVVVKMRRRAPTETVEPYRRRLHQEQGHALRDRLAEWGLQKLDKAEAHWPEMPHGIEDRPADVWEALLTVADLAGGTWPQRARVAAVTFVTDTSGGQDSLGVKLLFDCRNAFADAEQMRSTALLETLNALDESPWGDLKGKPLDSRRLSRLLKPYGIEPTTIRDGTETAKGYRRQDFHDAWLRYLPNRVANPSESVSSASVTDDDLPCPPYTSVTSVTGGTDDCPRCAGTGCQWCDQ